MPTWIISGIFVPFAVLVATLGSQLFFRWVPDAEEQKRHVRNTAVLVVEIASVALQVYFFYANIRYKGPVNAAFVTQVAFDSACTCFVLVGILLRRMVMSDLIGGLQDDLFTLLKHFGRNMDHTGRLIGIAELHKEALRCIASDPNLSAGTIEALRAILEPAPGAAISKAN
jgi:hypothetical protein